MSTQAISFLDIFKHSATYELIQEQKRLGLPIRYAEELASEFARHVNERTSEQLTQDDVRAVLVSEFA